MKQYLPENMNLVELRGQWDHSETKKTICKKNIFYFIFHYMIFIIMFHFLIKKLRLYTKLVPERVPYLFTSKFIYNHLTPLSSVTFLLPPGIKWLTDLSDLFYWFFPRWSQHLTPFFVFWGDFSNNFLYSNVLIAVIPWVSGTPSPCMQHHKIRKLGHSITYGNREAVNSTKYRETGLLSSILRIFL